MAVEGRREEVMLNLQLGWEVGMCTCWLYSNGLVPVLGVNVEAGVTLVVLGFVPISGRPLGGEAGSPDLMKDDVCLTVRWLVHCHIGHVVCGWWAYGGLHQRQLKV